MARTHTSEPTFWGTELFRLDPTTQRPKQVKDITPGLLSGNARDLTQRNGVGYFFTCPSTLPSPLASHADRLPSARKVRLGSTLGIPLSAEPASVAGLLGLPLYFQWASSESGGSPLGLTEPSDRPEVWICA